MEDGSVVTASRNVACIYYLTKGWREQYGGLLVDLEDAQHGQRTYVPEVRGTWCARLAGFLSAMPCGCAR